MMPTRSPTRLFIICVVSCLAFSRRLGAMSSANILLETSIAKTTSTPCLLTVCSDVPIFGFTKAMIKQTILSDSTMNFRTDLNTDWSGLKRANNSKSENSRFVFFFHICSHRNTINIPSTINKSQNQMSSSS